MRGDHQEGDEDKRVLLLNFAIISDSKTGKVVVVVVVVVGVVGVVRVIPHAYAFHPSLSSHTSLSSSSSPPPPPPPPPPTTTTNTTTMW